MTRPVFDDPQNGDNVPSTEQGSTRTPGPVPEHHPADRRDSTPTEPPFSGRAGEQIRRRYDEMPAHCRPGYLAAMRGRSRKAGIRAFCLECVGWEREEVRLCTSPACPLFPFRPFK